MDTAGVQLMLRVFSAPDEVVTPIQHSNHDEIKSNSEILFSAAFKEMVGRCIIPQRHYEKWEEQPCDTLRRRLNGFSDLGKAVLFHFLSFEDQHFLASRVGIVPDVAAHTLDAYAHVVLIPATEAENYDQKLVRRMYKQTMEPMSPDGTDDQSVDWIFDHPAIPLENAGKRVFDLLYGRAKVEHCLRTAQGCDWIMDRFWSFGRLGRGAMFQYLTQTDLSTANLGTLLPISDLSAMPIASFVTSVDLRDGYDYQFAEAVTLLQDPTHPEGFGDSLDSLPMEMKDAIVVLNPTFELMSDEPSGSAFLASVVPESVFDICAGSMDSELAKYDEPAVIVYNRLFRDRVIRCSEDPFACSGLEVMKARSPFANFLVGWLHYPGNPVAGLVHRYCSSKAVGTPHK